MLVGLGCALAAFLADQSREGYPGAVGRDVVAVQVSRTPATLWLAGGIVVAILASLLVLLGQAWTVYPLVVLGGSIVVSLSITNAPLAILAMAGLVFGTVPLAFDGAYRHLTEGRRS